MPPPDEEKKMAKQVSEFLIVVMADGWVVDTIFPISWDGALPLP